MARTHRHTDDERHLRIEHPDCQKNAILRLSYIVIMATGVAYLLVPIALKRIRPTTVSMYNNAQPIIASIVAILIGQDYFTWDKPVAALLVFLGVYLVTQSKSRAELEQQH